MKTISMMAAGALALSACGLEGDAGHDEANLDLAREVASEGLVAFVNNPATDIESLDKWVGIDLRAARGIVQARDGKDALPGTSDDVLFASVDAVDAVPYVGLATLDKLAAFAKSIGFFGDSLPGTYDGVYFSSAEVESTIEIANRGTPEQYKKLGLDLRQAANIAGARPIANMAALANVAYVGTATMTKIKAFVPVWNGGEEKLGQGAFFDGVPFGTLDIEIALEIANHATYEQLVVLGGIYQYGAKIIIANRPAGGYTTLSLVTAQRGIGPNSVERLLNFARNGKWTRYVAPAPVVTSLTQDQALVKARAELETYFVEVFAKSDAWTNNFAWSETNYDRFLTDVKNFGTEANPILEVHVTEDHGYAFVGQVAGLYTEVGVSYQGDLHTMLIEVD